MQQRLIVGLGLTVVLSVLAVPEAVAQITRIDLDVVESPALDGHRFGAVGSYELLRGLAYGEVDPQDPRHRDIVNIDRAPKNDAGLVEYRTTVEIYRPVDMTRWNRAIFHNVPNRGRSGDVEVALLERGFAMVRVGWQGDIAPTETNVVAELPVATHLDGSPITASAVAEFIFNDAERSSRGRLSYPAASRDQSVATLTVRQNQRDPRESPSGLGWSYVNRQEIEIQRPVGFDGGAIYEFVYPASDPIVMGLGFVAMRDAISFLRYDTADHLGNPNPLDSRGLPEDVLSVGRSQSGRFLRDFLYQGFNEDTSGRIVFDGLHPHIAGSRKTFTNYLFGQPGRWQKQHEDHDYPGDQFPFTYATLTDPISGHTDGLLRRCAASRTCPKIVHTDGEAELWQARSSLVVTDPQGKHIELPDNVRVYLIAGTQHGGGPGVHTAPPSFGVCQNLTNPLAQQQIRVALSLALFEWVVDGMEPPASRFPTVANGGLVSATNTGFPHIPGVTYQGSYNLLHLQDHSTIPPTTGDPYPVLVGRVDADGNMTKGIRHPNLVAPIGTYTGWNLRREGFAPGEQCAGAGSFIPFAVDRAAREVSGDPRLSLAERYLDHQAYVDAVVAAADALVGERLLLRQDADDVVALARQSHLSN